VMQRVRAERDRFVGFVQEAVESFDPNHLVQAEARFLDPHTLALSDGRTVSAERIVIAVGSRPTVPPPFQGAGDRILVNDDVFELEDLPGSMAVFGGGIIGIELGQALHRLGVRVTLFGKGGGVGPLSDPALVAYASDTLKAEMPFMPDAHVTAIGHDGDEVVITYKNGQGAEETERFDWLLAATGRRSNIDRLDIEKAGLALDARKIPLYDQLSTRCGDSHIFVAGDATGDLALLHEAADEGRLAGENARNDYLANIADMSEYAESMIGAFLEGNEATDLYPYLTQGEVEPVMAAFDRFFGTLQAVETSDGGYRLGSRPAGDLKDENYRIPHPSVPERENSRLSKRPTPTEES